MTVVRCMRCVVDEQNGTPLPYANSGEVLLYGGESLCIPHFNIARGYPATGPSYVTNKVTL